MDYQVNINYQFSAASEGEARQRAEQYIADNLTVKPVVDNLLLSPLQVWEQSSSFRAKKKEHFCVFFLNTQNQIVGREIVSIGTLNASLIHPRETFRTAIIKNCSAVIVAHNHPSGGLEPSAEDLHVTKRLVDAGCLLGIEVLDHVIVTAQSHASFKERGLI